MSKKLKACPFCGCTDNYITVTPNPFSNDIYSTGHCNKCNATGPFVAENYLIGEKAPSREHMEERAIERWNTRPIEDELRARIAELETDNDALKTENAELKERIGFLEINAIVYRSGQMANIARIAELEALVDELKPYRDGYDPEDVFPPEGEWVWLRDCDDNVEVMGYSQKEKCYWNYEGTRMPDDGDIVRWYPIGKLPEVTE